MQFLRRQSLEARCRLVRQAYDASFSQHHHFKLFIHNNTKTGFTKRGCPHSLCSCYRRILLMQLWPWRSLEPRVKRVLATIFKVSVHNRSIACSGVTGVVVIAAVQSSLYVKIGIYTRFVGSQQRRHALTRLIKQRQSTL